MGQWVVTVAGIAILSVLCDVILPEGQTRKYVKTVFGVVVTLVIVQPLIGLFSGDFTFSWSNTGGETVTVQEQYIENIEARQNETAANTLIIILEANGFTVENITVSQINKSVTLQLATKYGVQSEAKVREIVNSHFYGYETVITWT